VDAEPAHASSRLDPHFVVGLWARMRGSGVSMAAPGESLRRTRLRVKAQTALGSRHRAEASSVGGIHRVWVSSSIQHSIQRTAIRSQSFDSDCRRASSSPWLS
jgi:hypothetical protein